MNSSDADLTQLPEPADRTDSPAGRTERRLTVFLAVAAILVLVSRLAAIIGSELFPDEALYVWLSAVEPYGFAPHPPAVNFLARIGMGLLGRTEEGVRAMSFVLATLTPVPVYLLGRRLGGRAVGLWAALAALSIPIYAAFGAITTPDAPQLFLWTVALLCTARALDGGQLRWWAAAGAVIGAALLVKYIVVLYFPSLFLCLLLTPAGRAHLRSPGPWVAAALAALVFAPPFLVSQASSDWSALKYHLDDRQEFILPSATAFLVYQGLHVLYVSPILYGLALTGMIWAGVEGMRRRDERLFFLFSFSAVMWLFFAGIALVTKRELSREQWDAPAYVPAILAAALLIREKLGAPQERVRRRWRALAISGPALGLFLFVAMNAEGLSGRVTALMGDSPLYANFRGWRALADAADQALSTLPAGSSPSFFLGNSFAEAQQFDFYTAHPETRIFTLDNSANERFGLIPLLRAEGLDQSAMDKVEPGTNAVFAMIETIDPKDDSPKDKRRAKLRKFFRQVEPLPDVVIEVGGRPARRVTLYRCLDLK